MNDVKLKPGFSCLGVTDNCMFKCRMCLKWQDVEVGEYPNVEQYKNFLSQLRELVDENFVINFGGGEALLFKGLLELVNFSAKKGFWTNIASNGWLIDEEMAKRIADSGLNEINLSLDSFDEDTHDYLRGVKGAYRQVTNAIDYISEYSRDTKIGISSVIYDQNLDGLIRLAEWAISNERINAIYFLAPMQPNNTPIEKQWWKGKYSYLWPKDVNKACLFLDRLLDLKLHNNHKIGNKHSQLEAFKSYFCSPDKFVKIGKCNLDCSVQINAKGDIFLCSHYGALGNIKSGEDFRKLWSSTRAAEIRQKMAACKDNCHFRFISI